MLRAHDLKMSKLTELGQINRLRPEMHGKMKPRCPIFACQPHQIMSEMKWGRSE